MTEHTPTQEKYSEVSVN